MHPQKSQKPNLNKFNYCSAPLPHGKLPERKHLPQYRN